MEIEILQLLKGARQAKGLTVIIVVFRAFTTEKWQLSFLYTPSSKRLNAHPSGCAFLHIFIHGQLGGFYHIRNNLGFLGSTALQNGSNFV